MATITKPGFLAAMSLEPTLSRTPAPAAEEHPPRGRSRTRRRRHTEGSTDSEERSPRNGLDLGSGNQRQSSSHQQPALAGSADATDGVRDFAVTELALNQRGNSQMPSTANITSPAGELSFSAAKIDVPNAAAGATLSRDRALLNANLGDGNQASIGMIAGLPTIVVDHAIGAHTHVGALFCTDGRNHVPGVTFSQTIGAATIAGAAIVLGKMQAKATILQIDGEKKQALVRHALSHVVGVIINGNTTFGSIGPAARIGYTYGKDVSLTSWVPYRTAEADQARNGLLRSTFQAVYRGKKYLGTVLDHDLLNTADSNPALKVGDTLQFNTLGSLVMGMGAAVFGAFAGSGVVASGEHAVAVTRQSDNLYLVDVHSKLARMGNITVELPVLASLQATYGDGASTFNRLSIDTSHTAAAGLLTDIVLGRPLPFEERERNWFWRRIPGSQAMAVDPAKLERYVNNPASMIYDFKNRSPLRGVTYLQSEISRLKPALSIGASVSFFTYVLFNALGSFERVIDRDRRVSVAVSGNESRRIRERIFRSRKNVPGVKQESVEAKIADETIVRVLSSDPSRVLRNDPTWSIEAKFNTSYHGKPELKRTFGWLADKLLRETDGAISSEMSQVSRKKNDTRLAVGFKKTLKLDDVFGLISTSPLESAAPYRDVMATIAASSASEATKRAELVSLAEDFMQQVVIPQLHSKGVRLVKELHRDTRGGAAPLLVYEDEAVEKAKHELRKLVVTQATPMLDKSPAQLKKTIKRAEHVEQLAQGAQQRALSLDRSALGRLDTRALDDLEATVAELRRSAHEAVRIEPRDEQMPLSAAIDEVARRVPSRQAQILKRLQTPPPSRRPSVSALSALNETSPWSSEFSTTPQPGSAPRSPHTPVPAVPAAEEA